MTTPTPLNALDLARRAVACSRWRWMPGMLARVPWPDPLAPSYDFRVISARPTEIVAYDESDRNPARWHRDVDGWRVSVAIDAGPDDDPSPHDRLWRPAPITQYAAPSRWTPDLTDPATLGCLLALVRETQRDPLLYVARNCGIFEVNSGEGEPSCAHDTLFDGPTEAAALVAALEGAV